MRAAAAREGELNIRGLALARLGRADFTADARSKHCVGRVADRRGSLRAPYREHRTDRQRKRDGEQNDERYDC